MRDPFYWSISLGRIFGINVRIHWSFPLVAAALVLRAVFPKEGEHLPAGSWIDASVIVFLLFLSVLLHEFGHCFGARGVNGDASDVLLWPLGGLASVDVPNTARANFITAASGPLVNLGLCVLAAGLLPFVHDQSIRPWLDPLTPPLRDGDGFVSLPLWSGSSALFPPLSAAVWLSRLFWVNYFLFLFNILLIGFPMDSGRMLQSVLWNYVGYRQATFIAVFAGFFTVFVVGLYGLVRQEMLALCLAVFIFLSCKQQYLILETGGDESVFGYDFSQGYTSLEREQAQPSAPPLTPRLSWWQRWQQARNAKRLQREMETREADEGRMDALLEKISNHGMGSLSEEERRFMKQFSDRYKNRK